MTKAVAIMDALSQWGLRGKAVTFLVVREVMSGGVCRCGRVFGLRHHARRNTCCLDVQATDCSSRGVRKHSRAAIFQQIAAHDHTLA